MHIHKSIKYLFYFLNKDTFVSNGTLWLKYSTFLRFAFYLEDNKMSNEHSDHFIPPLALINIGTRIAKKCLYSFKNAMNYVHNEIWRHLDVIGLYMTPIMLWALLTTTYGGLLLKKSSLSFYHLSNYWYLSGGAAAVLRCEQAPNASTSYLSKGSAVPYYTVVRLARRRHARA